MKRIDLARPYIDSDDLAAVSEVLQSGWLTSGARVEAFEEAFAKYIGTRFAVAVNSGTAALHLSLAASGIGGGDEVIVPSLTFVATANAVLYQGAKPVFADIEEETLGIDPESLRQRLTDKTRAIIPVHVAGHPADMAPIREIAEEKHLIVIEDAAEALGAEYYGRKVGSFGIGCFSFYPSKNITTGEGGMITTDSGGIAEESRVMRAHGITKSAREEERPWERLQTSLGYNYRMTDIQGALGLSQLKKLERMNETRVSHAEYLSKRLSDLNGVMPPIVKTGCRHVYQMYMPRVGEGIDRDRLVLSLRDRGIEASVHFMPPVHLMPYYREKYGYDWGSLPRTEAVSRSVFTLPMHPGLTREDLDQIVSATGEAIRLAKRH